MNQPNSISNQAQINHETNSNSISYSWRHIRPNQPLVANKIKTHNNNNILVASITQTL